MKRKTKSQRNSGSKKDKMTKTRVIGIAIIAILLAGILVISYLINSNKMTGDVLKTENKEKESFSFYDDESCRCIERNRPKCYDDTWRLDLERRLCVRGTNVTHFVLSCSEYECSGQIYEFNDETKIWEAKNNILE